MNKWKLELTSYSVSDLLSWYRNGQLKISPYFQRRNVWPKEMKSFFIDTVIKDLPSPAIILREYRDTSTFEIKKDVIDGQQRLYTIFSFIAPDLFSEEDIFSVLKIHNKQFAKKTYINLPDEIKKQILSYKFSVQVLPHNVTDREVIEIFQRINSTGVIMNEQEKRNAKYFGAFKSLVYSISTEQINRLLGKWNVLNYNDISRMKEVEFVNELCIFIIDGYVKINTQSINKYYKNYNDSLPNIEVIEKRVKETFDAIDNIYGKKLKKSTFSGKIQFYSLFATFYDLLYGINSKLVQVEPKKLPGNLFEKIEILNRKYLNKNVPSDVIDAKLHSTREIKRRKINIDYILSEIKND